MKQSDSIVNLAKALVIVQQNVTPVTKDRTNPHFGRTYATFDSIMETVRPLLAGNGLAVVQGGAGPVSDINGHICGVSVETLLVHSSGEYVSSIFTLPLDKATAQAVGSAVTYGRRYGVSSLLALTTEEDDDGHVASAIPAVRAATAAALQTNAAKEPANAVARSAPATNGANDPSCPVCGGAMWDDRLTKKNPSAPDFKCKNKPKVQGGPGCAGVIWPPKNARVPAVVAAGGDEADIYGDPPEDDFGF